MKMAEDSDGGGGNGCLIETVITCSGDLHDPCFPHRFKHILSGLRGLLCKGSGEWLRVSKVEPWNSVRVTFTIPAEAAARLRALAIGGDQSLARLGILSVQVQPDQVISVRLGGGGSGGLASAPGGMGGTPAGLGGAAGGGEGVEFRSPNVVAPPSEVPAPPKHPLHVAAAAATAVSSQQQPNSTTVFPFASMTHAACAIHTREHAQVYPPPPYPGRTTAIATVPSGMRDSGGSGDLGGAPVAMTSPLLVNLLQTDAAGAQVQSSSQASGPSQPGQQPLQQRGVTKVGEDERGGVSSAFVQVGGSGPGRARPPPSYPSSASPPPPQTPSSPSGGGTTTTPQLTSSGKRIQYLINPLTGVLEPMSSESSDESDTVLSPHHNRVCGRSTSSIFSDEDEDDMVVSSRSIATGGATVAPTATESEATVATPVQRPNEKIKLRLKLEKNEPAYKVDFVKSGGGGAGATSVTPEDQQPRVPPLHISLRGRNAAVVMRKEKKTRDVKLRVRKVGGGSPEPGGGSSVPAGGPGGPPGGLLLRHDETQSTVGTQQPSQPTPQELPVSSFPSEAEVASILRSMPSGNALLETDESKLKKRDSKKKVYPRDRGGGGLLRVEEKRAKKAGGSCSLLKTVVKSAAKEVRMMSAVARIAKASAAGLMNNGIVTPRPQETKEAFQVCKGSRCVSGGLAKRDEGYRGKVKVTVKGTSEEGANKREARVVPTPRRETQGKLPVTELDVTETKLKARLLDDDPKEPKGSAQGDDSGIESMDALSEKSPNQGESPGRGGEPDRKVTGAGPPGGPGGGAGPPGGPGGGGGKTGKEEKAPSPEDPVPVRLTPALYTYSNPERHNRDETPTPSPPSPHINSGESGESVVRHGGKSLLEQLLIEIPGESSGSTPGGGGGERRSQRSTRNRARSPGEARASPGATAKRQRKPSEGSDPPTPRPSKRKCSENAAELIKACMGLEEQQQQPQGNGPKPASLLHHHQQQPSPVAKTRKPLGVGGGESDSSGDESRLVKDEALHRLRPPPHDRNVRRSVGGNVNCGVSRRSVRQQAVSPGKTPSSAGGGGAPPPGGSAPPTQEETTPRRKTRSLQPHASDDCSGKVGGGGGGSISGLSGGVGSTGPSVAATGATAGGRRRPSRDGK